jgi:hypothetical protein
MHVSILKGYTNVLYVIIQNYVKWKDKSYIFHCYHNINENNYF